MRTDEHDGRSDPKPQPAEGRDAKGRFTRGNKGGPGNPFARKIAMLRQTLVNFVTEDDMKHIAFVLKMKAESGDIQAMKLLFQYVIGKPQPATDPDRLDIDEWQTLQEHARSPGEVTEILETIPAKTASELTRIAWPCAVETNLRAPVLAGFKELDDREARLKAAAEKRASKKERRHAAGREKETVSPMTNGGNGAHNPGQRLTADSRPSTNGGNGDLEARDRLITLFRQAMARQADAPTEDFPSPDGDNGDRRADGA
jgi:hypothetical protein